MIDLDNPDARSSRCLMQSNVTRSWFSEMTLLMLKGGLSVLPFQNGMGYVVVPVREHFEAVSVIFAHPSWSGEEDSGRHPAQRKQGTQERRCS